MRAQWRAKSPFIKQAWKKIVVTAKVLMQAAALDAIGENSTPLRIDGAQDNIWRYYKHRSAGCAILLATPYGAKLSDVMLGAARRECSAQLWVHGASGMRPREQL